MRNGRKAIMEACSVAQGIRERTGASSYYGFRPVPGPLIIEVQDSHMIMEIEFSIRKLEEVSEKTKIDFFKLEECDPSFILEEILIY